MLGVIGIILSLFLLMYLAYRGINVLVLAPIMALLAVLIGGGADVLLPTYTQVFMKELGGYLIKFFPLFMLGAIFGKLMDDSGSARSIALSTLGTKYLELANAAGISPELLHRVAVMSSGCFDSLPHNGAVITLLGICRLTHRQSYFDIFIVTVAIPLSALVVVITLGTLFGSF